MPPAPHLWIPAVVALGLCSKSGRQSQDLQGQSFPTRGQKLSEASAHNNRPELAGPGKSKMSLGNVTIRQDMGGGGVAEVLEALTSTSRDTVYFFKL